MGDDSANGERRDGKIGRRRYLRSVAAATAGGGLASMLADRPIARPVEARPAMDATLAVDDSRDPTAVFPQAVMSGGPTDRGVILWTRVAPAVLTDGVPLGVEVATDEAFEDVVFRGAVPAERITPSRDHTVKVDLDGELASNARYHYRFVYDGTPSQTGRCRTLPASDDDVGELSFAVLACQDYQNGYYGAYHHVAESDVDFLVHLGDFIYESANGAYTAPNRPIPEDRNFELPSGKPLAETLEDFRFLYRTYKSDPLMQEGLAAHTLIAGWDDHEIANNRYWDYAADAPVLPDKADGNDPEFALELTANGIQAWVEHVPARVEYDPSATDLHEQFRLSRTVEFGDLAEFVVTDERLFRDGPACPGERLSCGREDAQDRTMLGERQKEWWKSRMSESTATWTVWLNEVLTLPLTLGTGSYQVEILQDSWDGFQAERYELMQHLAAEGPDNVIALTGDLHCSLAGYMESHYGEVGNGKSGRVGVELVTPAVSSLTADSLLDFSTPWDSEALNDLATAQNGHIQFMDWYRNGYSVVTFTDDECRYTAYEVDATTDSADAERSKLAEYRVPAGDVELDEQYNRFEENLGSGWF
ncbi:MULTISPECIES: alkaline phosphatase D family protein [Salinibaculum]|uniref:alkaline phosphatase D family protein n=1 Tax=Salinibaculum TaxID=2732368 RepID=UPI0030D4E077